MRSTPAQHDSVFNLSVFVHPGMVFTHPQDVVSNLNLSLAFTPF